MKVSLYTRVSRNRKRQYKPINKKTLSRWHRLRPALCPQVGDPDRRQLDRCAGGKSNQGSHPTDRATLYCGERTGEACRY